MAEEWKPINGFEGYFISNLGNVMSTKYSTNKLLKKRENIDGYYVYQLYKDGKGHSRRRGRMIAEHFIEIPDWLSNDCAIINHKDGNKKNDSIDNLEWTNTSGNAIHAWDNGLINRDTFMNSKRKSMKPIYKIDRNTNTVLKEYESYREACRLENLNSGNLSKAVRTGSLCGGYVWVYREDYNNNKDYRNPTKKFLGFNREYGFFIFSNIAKFSHSHGLSSSSVGKCIRQPKTHKSHNGWKFKRIK